MNVTPLFKRSNYLRSIEHGSKFVLFHSLYGNATEVDSTTKDALFSPDESIDLDYSRIADAEGLVQQGFLVPVDLDERKQLEDIIRIREKHATEGKFIHNLQLNVTEDCNFACRYCIQRRGIDSDDRRNEQEKRMQWDTAKFSIDEFMGVMKVNGNKRGHIMFFGGEPLLNWGVIRRTMEYIAEKYDRMNISFVITSNGSLVTSDMAKIMADHHVIFQSSLDGLKKVNDQNRIDKQGNGTFDMVDRGLRLLSESGVNVNLGTVISGTTIDTPYLDFVDYAKSLGVRNIEINPEETLYKTTNRIKIADKLLDLIGYGIEQEVNVFTLLEIPILNMIYDRQGACSAAATSLSVEPSGDVYFCRCLSKRAGSIFDLDAIFNSDYFRRMATRIEGNIDNCYNCILEGLCGGGCSANAEKLAGDVYSNDSTRCTMTKRVVTEELRRYGLRKPSAEANRFIDVFRRQSLSEDEVEKQLTASGLVFWDKEIVRRDLGHQKEREYVPVRMIDY